MDPAPDYTYAKPIYLTNEQIARIAALSLDSLAGVEILADAKDNTYCHLAMHNVDNPEEHENYEVFTDGQYLRTT